MELIVVPSMAFAGAAVAALSGALARIERPCLGLPTGSTPVPLLEALSASRFRFPAGTRAFAVDEYCWPEMAHPGTNASFFRRYWRSGEGVPEVMVPRGDAADPEAEIQAYCRMLSECGGLDVVLLGIGMNGHIAFNEPGSERDSICRVVPLAEQTRRSAAADWNGEPPTHGMTIGVREIMAARHVILLATGAAKRQVLRDALSGPVTSDLPASILQEHQALTVVCDSEAWGPNPPTPFPAREGGA